MNPEQLTNLITHGGVIAVQTLAILFLVKLWRLERAERRALQETLMAMSAKQIEALIRAEHSTEQLRHSLGLPGSGNDFDGPPTGERLRRRQ